MISGAATAHGFVLAVWHGNDGADVDIICGLKRVLTRTG